MKVSNFSANTVGGVALVHTNNRFRTRGGAGAIKATASGWPSRRNGVRSDRAFVQTSFKRAKSRTKAAAAHALVRVWADTEKAA